jgi:acyl dehydratase
LANFDMHKWQTGYEFPPLEYRITRDIVNKYEASVEAGGHSLKFIPPLAVAAFAMKVMSESSDFPPGIVHASQEFKFMKQAVIGSGLTCRAKVLQVIPRSSLHILTIEINTFDEKGDMVLTGKATAFLPGEE